jgi:hypothetical protein
MAAAAVRGLPGPVLEVGLGKGRTFDHLRHRLPGRRILCLDMDLHAPTAARPDTDDLVLGDFRDTLPALRERLGADLATLVHADFGSEDRAHDAAQADWLGGLLRPLVRPGGLIVADRPLRLEGCTPLLPPADLAWPYFGWRAS